VRSVYRCAGIGDRGNEDNNWQQENHMDSKLVRETAWAKVYQTSSGAMLTESKFLDDQFTVRADEIAGKWPTMTNNGQLDFLIAFLARPRIHAEDKKILDFLMELDDRKVWIMIAPLMAKYPNRDQALTFLLKIIKTNTEGLANCYHALELMNDPRAVPSVRMKYESYRARFLSSDETQMGTIALVDYAYCCSALRKLEPRSEYDDVLRALKSVPDERVANQANRILHG